MFQPFKRKGLLWLLVLFIAVAGIGAWLFGPMLRLLRGPADITALSADELEGAYVRLKTDMLIDSYAETIQSRKGGPEELLRREYVLQTELADGEYVAIGVEVLKDNIAVADLIVEDTYDFLTNGDYEWNGASLELTGTVLRMDEETEAFWNEVTSYLYGAGHEEYCRPLVLREGYIGRLDTGTLAVLGALEALLLAAFVFVLIATRTRRPTAPEEPAGTQAALSPEVPPAPAEAQLADLPETPAAGTETAEATPADPPMAGTETAGAAPADPPETPMAPAEGQPAVPVDPPGTPGEPAEAQPVAAPPEIAAEPAETPPPPPAEL